MNIYNKFRGVEQLANQYSLSKRFDEPTYFTFRLVFANRFDYTYNLANKNTVSYDTMPHPLFLINENTEIGISDVDSYSAVRYLEDANEPTRAAMLREFIQIFDYLQNNYQYYFQQIDGISDLIKIDPIKGQRIGNDKKITITCLEGLDLRMSYLMNLYKKIAWDDVYQRWVLPDMMRYFTLKVYLTEFRTFHTSGENKDAYGLSKLKTPTNNLNLYPNSLDIKQLIQRADIIKKPISKPIFEVPTYLTILDDILPTWEITCEMCEFDITDISFTHLDGLDVADDPTQGTVKFGIKIGNIKEMQTYPVFKHMFLNDRKLNGINRAREEISTHKQTNNQYLYPASLQIGQARTDETNPIHESGRPIVERANEDTTVDMKNAIVQPKPSSNLDSQFYNDRSGQPKYPPTSAIDPNTWVGNAITFGAAFAKNIVKKVIDKGKMTPIPGLGISFTEIQAALEAKNIIGALGLIRKGISEVSAQKNGPSSRLTDVESDSVMKDFLTELSKVPKSAATDDIHEALAKAANLALTDSGTWEAIKDFSRATNMVGSGEINTQSIIQPVSYPQPSDKSLATDLVGTDLNNTKEINVDQSLIESAYIQPINKSTATQSTLQIGQVLEAPPSSKATNSKLE